jgi:hypothetical protein
VTLDGKDEVIAAASERHEAFRELAAGEHRVTFHDAAAQPGDELALNFVQLKPYFE